MPVSGGSTFSGTVSKKASRRKAADVALTRAEGNRYAQRQVQLQSTTQFQRLIDEDERRRRLLGGGGGGGRKLSPYVPFSFLSMNYRIDQTRLAIDNLIKNSLLNKSPNIPSIQNLPVIKQIIQGLAKLQNSITNLFANIAKAPQSLLNAAKGLAQNFAALATVSMSALLNLRFFKYILGKDEDLDLKEEEPGEEDKFGLLDKLKALFLNKKNEHHENRRSIFSHFEKISDQITNFLFP